MSTITRKPGSTQGRTYDALGRLVQTTGTTAAGKLDIYYTYSRFDALVARHVMRNDVLIEATSYSRDLLDRMVGQRVKTLGLGQSSSEQSEQITTWRYNQAGQVVRRILPNGVRQTFAYDSAGRLSQIKYQEADANATLIEQLDYTYDVLGRRTAKTLLGASDAPETPMSATYDSANRMSAITLEPATPQEKRYALSYDDNGALRVKQRIDAQGSPVNQSALDKTEYVWDARGRLSQIKQGAATATTVASFAYDHAGRRISRSVQDGAASSGSQISTQYLYDGQQAIGEVRDGKLAASLVSGLGLDEAIARITSSGAAGAGGAAGAPEVKSYLTDALGSVIAQLRADQSVEVGYAYSPYGQTLKAGAESGSASSANPVQYTGRENDGAQGGTGGGELYYYRARYYDPVLKRFISSDPIGLAGGLNTYGYVGGNPLGYTDPYGLWRLPDFVNFQIDYYVGSVSGTFSRSGNSFLGFGVNRGFPNPLGAGASVSTGWLNTCDAKATGSKVDSFLGGFAGGGASAYAGVGGGILVSPGNGTASVIGIGAGVAVGGSSKFGGAPSGGWPMNQGNTGLGGW